MHLLELEPGDVHEEPAGSRLAAAACGANVEVKGYTGGQWTLAARGRGLVGVNAAAVAAVNGLEGMSVFTLYDLQPVESGEPVARAKITPLAIPERLVKDAERPRASAGGLVSVKPFRPHVLAALAGRPCAAAAPALRVVPDREGGLVRLAAPARCATRRGTPPRSPSRWRPCWPPAPTS